MNSLTNTAGGAPVTMTSLELVEYINQQRGANEAELRHRDFTAKVPKVIGEEMSEKFRTSLKDSYGRDQSGFAFPKREACLMAMSYSYDLQAKVFDKMTALEEQTRIAIPNFLNPAIEAFKMIPHVTRAARALGLDKNAAVISANQAVFKLTKVNALALLGQTHLESEQQVQFFTPTELGAQINIGARKFNELLSEAGLQERVGDVWVPGDSAKGFFRLMDTGKRHGDGTMIQQLKWSQAVLQKIEGRIET
jgi:hypothetical protein